MFALFSSVSILGILLAGASSMLVGMIWYSPSVFGPAWVAWSGVRMDKMDPSAAKRAYVASALGALVFATVLAHLMVLIDVRSLSEAWVVAFELWAGLIVTTQVIHGFFDSRDKRLILLSCGHELANILVMTTVLRFVP